MLSEDPNVLGEWYRHAERAVQQLFHLPPPPPPPPAAAAESSVVRRGGRLRLPSLSLRSPRARTASGGGTVLNAACTDGAAAAAAARTAGQPSTPKAVVHDERART